MVDFKKKIAGKTTKLAGTSLDSVDFQSENPLIDSYIEGTLYKIPLTSISADPNQPRKHFDEKKLDELADSIKSKGVLQPILIRRNDTTAGDGKEFIIVAGERRFRASKMIGLKIIPAIYTTGDPEEIALIENLQRDDLKPIEEAEAYQKIIESHGYTQEQLSVVMGKARTTITEYLTLNKLPEEIKEDCRTLAISKIVLLEIAKRKNKQEAIFLYNKVKSENFTVAKIKQLTRPKAKRKKSLVEERALANIIELKKLLAKISKDAMNPKDKERLRAEWNDLQQLMNNLMADT
ncbi:MAG: ParB/RepB/Spo0J family partition protein [Pseudomonadota bacterium]